MSLHYATITPMAANDATTELVRSWKAHFCNGTLGQLAFSVPDRSRLYAQLNGHIVALYPSSFALDNVMLVVLVRTEATYRVGFYDLAAGKFLPAIADLSIAERGKLGSSRSRVRDNFLRELIEVARKCPNPRAVVGA